MAILKVARMGNPVLRRKARPLTVDEIGSDDIKRLIGDMIETMEEYGGIGLAAPQVHQSVQLVIIGFSEENERYPEQRGIPLTVLINPVVTVLDPVEQSFWEGCLSVPELRGRVPRPRKVQIEYLDKNAKPRIFIAEDFLATVFQHELDHLQGALYIDRIRDTTQLSFLEEYQRFWAEKKSEKKDEIPD